MAAVSLVLGIAGYLSWKGSQAEEEELPGMPSRIAEGRFALKEAKYRILLPLANPANVDRLIEFASAIARDNDGQIIALRVVLVPDQLAPSEEEIELEKERSVLELAHRKAHELDVPITTLVRIGHDAARAILETAREQHCDLIMLGWKGYTSTARKIMGEVTDAVITHAKRDIMLVKLPSDGEVGRYLLPTAGGSHARRAEFYARSIIRHLGGSLTVCSVAQKNTSASHEEEIQNRLNQAVERLSRGNGITVDQKIIRSDSITNGIIGEANKHDALIIGAAGDSIYKQMLFGNIPETIARNIDRPVILVKYYQPVKDLLGRVMKE
jgi:nucleotide-binding universal stress UspA family protein